MFPITGSVGHAVYTAGATDTHGNPIDSWATPVDVDVCGYGPRFQSTEPGGTQVIVGLTLYAPASVVIGAKDRVVVNGLTYTVEGEMGDWDNGPFGFKPGVRTFDLKRVEGGV